jgi:acyl-CoA synthetase (AMP-forming)/AMP-acid ligase II
VIRIVDEDDNDVKPGETGRIFIGNQMAFEGYTGGGGKDSLGDLLSSGDVGHFDEDGRLFIDGRDDEMIVSGGENVFPREVEDLLSDHSDVSEAAAIGVDDEQFGQRLRAFVVKEEGADVSEDELKDHVKANLARYKVPREIVFVDELPRNATGKVLKRELAEYQPAD